MGSNDCYYRVDGLPATVGKEFRDAADQGGFSLAKAFVRLLRRVGDVPAAVGEGQRRMVEVRGEERTRIDLWLSGDVKRELIDFAEQCDVHLGALGRLLMVGRRGRIFETIAGEGAGDEEPVVAVAAAGE